MVVVDPVFNHWGGIKENDNSDVRKVLKPIQRLAAETGVAFLLITHFGKAIKEEAADKVIGSIAITAVARTVWHLYRDKDRKDHRYFVPSKDNILVDPTGVEFVVNREAGGRVEILSCDGTESLRFRRTHEPTKGGEIMTIKTVRNPPHVERIIRYRTGAKIIRELAARGIVVELENGRLKIWNATIGDDGEFLDTPDDAFNRVADHHDAVMEYLWRWE